MIYQLMHKDKVCGELTEMSGVIQSYQDNGEGFSPFFATAILTKSKNGGRCDRFWHPAMQCRKCSEMPDMKIRVLTLPKTLRSAYLTHIGSGRLGKI